jgi:hypothetical protein
MPNSKERKKKDGQNVGKKIERSKEAQEERHRQRETQESSPQTDQGDIMDYKPGTASDRNRQNAT